MRIPQRVRDVVERRSFWQSESNSKSRKGWRALMTVACAALLLSASGTIEPAPLSALCPADDNEDCDFLNPQTGGGMEGVVCVACDCPDGGDGWYWFCSNGQTGTSNCEM
ncbi:MAG: hypothetical protein F4X00_00945 [Gemmatimonadetes bacterium]|nr:hypothetical protein [Gemmatimonadota bacterium]MYG23587.1 hypothetical protein [Gemmatimonadota bacterium]